ncbi:thioredoxin-like protein [Ephemerocybe angulata]|uniref:thioredoxin-dependent peroxiredoxin n=1 Tax=Ephemerocybe angulata TaxID=980116 RepID=A0A8H6I283_9AGAR|nr:thioredoxin-like protein [Tulosesus angulatus]
MTIQDLVGKTAPSFSLPNHDGTTYEFKAGESGLPTALLFYPESGSYGCTQQMCGMRDAVVEKTLYAPDKAQVIAISPNTVEKQKAFAAKEGLTFPVLSDEAKEVSKSYGIGRGMFGISPIARCTFIVDKKGVVRDAMDSTINYGAHQKFVDKWLQKLADEGEGASS